MLAMFRPGKGLSVELRIGLHEPQGVLMRALHMCRKEK